RPEQERLVSARCGGADVVVGVDARSGQASRRRRGRRPRQVAPRGQGLGRERHVVAGPRDVAAPGPRSGGPAGDHAIGQRLPGPGRQGIRLHRHGLQGRDPLRLPRAGVHRRDLGRCRRPESGAGARHLRRGRRAAGRICPGARVRG
ncbi:unnamed protein product, partial [Prorocentrum cordatum]